MENKDKNKGEIIQDKKSLGLDGTATHSGWTHFYNSFSKYRDECIILGQRVMGNNLSVSTATLSLYYSSLYSLAQQVFSFYNEEIEEELTIEWLKIGEKVYDYLGTINDKDFRNQMIAEGKAVIDIKLKVELLKYFNKVDRMAAVAGLLVGQENKGSVEPKKGLIGFTKRA